MFPSKRGSTPSTFTSKRGSSFQHNYFSVVEYVLLIGSSDPTAVYFVKRHGIVEIYSLLSDWKYWSHVVSHVNKYQYAVQERRVQSVCVQVISSACWRNRTTDLIITNDVL